MTVYQSKSKPLLSVTWGQSWGHLWRMLKGRRPAASEGIWHCCLGKASHRGQGSEITSWPYVADGWICYRPTFLQEQALRQLTSAFSWKKSQGSGESKCYQ